MTDFLIERERQAATRGPDSGSYLVAEELQRLKQEIIRLIQERDALREELGALRARRCETCRFLVDIEARGAIRYVCDLADACAPNGFHDWEAQGDES